MKKLNKNFIGGMCFIFVLVFLSQTFSSVTYSKKSGAGIGLYVVEIKLEKEKIIPVSAQGMNYDAKLFKDESFDSMVKRVKAVGAINGCYFDKKTLKPIGDVAENGIRFHNGGGWAYFGVKYDGSVEFGTDNPVQSRHDWSDFQMGITCIPLLIQDGNVLINSAADLKAAGFKDPHVFANMPRSAIAQTKDGKILFVSSSSTKMLTFAKALKAIGVVNALGLDGGASTAMYYNGKTILSAGRKLTTILAVIKTSENPYKKIENSNNNHTTNNDNLNNDNTNYNQNNSLDNSNNYKTPTNDNNENYDSSNTQVPDMGDESIIRGVVKDCKTCKSAIDALKQSGSSEITNCIIKYCKKKGCK